jgi:hypothetical protein
MKPDMTELAVLSDNQYEDERGEIQEKENRVGNRRGFYSREHFGELWEEEDRLRTNLPGELSDHWVQDQYSRAVKFDRSCFEFEAVSMPREHDWGSGNFEEDLMIKRLDRKYSKKQRRKHQRLQRRFLDRRTGEPRPGVRIVKVGEKAA